MSTTQSPDEVIAISFCDFCEGRDPVTQDLRLLPGAGLDDEDLVEVTMENARRIGKNIRERILEIEEHRRALDIPTHSGQYELVFDRSVLTKPL